MPKSGSDVGAQLSECLAITTCNQLTIWMTPCFAAARVRLSSPSGCPSFPSAVALCASTWSRTALARPTREAVTHDVHWHTRLLPEDGRGPVNSGDVAHNPRAEPYSRRHRTRSMGGAAMRGARGGRPVVRGVVLAVRDLIVSSGRVVCPCFFCEGKARNSLQEDVRKHVLPGTAKENAPRSRGG